MTRSPRGEKRGRKTEGGTFFSPPRRNKFANEKERKISISPPRRSLLDTPAASWKYSKGNYICLDLFFFFFPKEKFQRVWNILLEICCLQRIYTTHAIDHWKINTRFVCIISILASYAIYTYTSKPKYFEKKRTFIAIRLRILMRLFQIYERNAHCDG